MDIFLIVIIFFAIVGVIAAAVFIGEGAAKRAAYELLDDPHAPAEEVRAMIKRLNGFSGLSKDDERTTLIARLQDRLADKTRRTHQGGN